MSAFIGRAILAESGSICRCHGQSELNLPDDFGGVPFTIAGLRAGHPPADDLCVPIGKQVHPFRIRLLDERDFPRAVLALQTCLALDGVRVTWIFLEINEAEYSAFPNELRTAPFAMRLYAVVHVGRHADVQRNVALARKDVDEVGHEALRALP